MAPKAREKPKSPASSPKPVIPVEDLFTSLNRHIKNSDYQQAIKVTDQILSTSPGDEDALRCKIVALIKADDLDRALSTIQDAQRFSIDLSFYKAYCFYRQNKLHEAMDSLKNLEKNSSVLQLEAQIFYRLGKMDSCMETYEKLQCFSIEADVKVNIIAALVSAGKGSEVQKTMNALKIKAGSSFELAYNVACSLIELKKYSDAEQLLLSARRIGQEILVEEDYADDEIETELSPVAVQLAYVRQQLGHPEEALESYANIIRRNLADPSSLAIATNNSIALKTTKETSDSLRKFDKLIEKTSGSHKFHLAHGLDHKLSFRQKEAIYSNRLLLLLHANRMDQARELVASLPEMFPNSVSPILLQAAVLVRENKAGKAEEILGQLAEKYPDKAKIALLARAQIAATVGHSLVAAESLSRISDIQHMPATVATLVSLRERSSDVAGAFSVLDSAIQWWTNSMRDSNNLGPIMREAASFNLKHGREEVAASLFEELVKKSESVEALAGLVATIANVDIEKAESYAKRLKPLPGLKEIDVNSLEKTPGAKPVDITPLSSSEAYEETKMKTKSKKKRKRKPRYPKGFDPSNPGPPPDPERWLPRRERSSYRPKRRDKRQMQVRGSQGAVVKEKHEPATAAANVLNTPSASQSAPSAAAGSSKITHNKSSKSRKKSRS